MLDLRLTGLTDLVVADIYIVAFILLIVAFILAIEDESSPKVGTRRCQGELVLRRSFLNSNDIIFQLANRADLVDVSPMLKESRCSLLDNQFLMRTLKNTQNWNRADVIERLHSARGRQYE